MNARIKAVPHVIYKPFTLATVAGRTALFIGLTAGTVPREEVEAAVLQDNEKRPYRKPVVAYGKRHSSITRAAEMNCPANASLNQLKTEQARIRNLCNKDDTVGFYWAE